VHSLVVLDDGHLVSASSGNSDNDIVIWNVSTAVPINTLRGHLKAVMCLTVLGGNRIASGSMDHSIIIWDSIKGIHLKTLQGHQLEVRSIVELEDDRLASGSEDNTIKVWNLKSGQEITTFKNITSMVFF